MGVVYLGVAWDGSQVAVKVLRPELANNPEFRLFEVTNQNVSFWRFWLFVIK